MRLNNSNLRIIMRLIDSTLRIIMRLNDSNYLLLSMYFVKYMSI
jgi:hypothetical protein